MIIQTGNRTDIPAFYAEWFANRLKEGFLIGNYQEGDRIHEVPQVSWIDGQTSFLEGDQGNP